MDGQLFINRETELDVLHRAFTGTSPAFFVLYGRRRVGKSALLHRACDGLRNIYFTADLGSPRDQLTSFAPRLAEGLGEAAWSRTVLPSWEEALQICIEQAREDPLVLVLDEFQNLVNSDPSLASVLQRLWDGPIRHSRMSVVLCGSYVSFMEREVLGVRNPLYGRRTGQLLLRPLLLRDAARFFPGKTAEERLEAVAILGGVPAYLERFDPRRELAENVHATILGLGAPLFDEPRFLMLEELREPQLYFSICRAIAHGNHRPNAIAQAAGLAGRANPASYLATLREMHLVERRIPATVRNPERSRRGLYRLRDPFLRFWFRFVLPSRTALEAGDAELVWERKIAPQLSHHVAQVFEDAAREDLRARNRRGELPAVYDRIGSWWRGRDEVDVVAVADDGPLLVGECKWSVKPVGMSVLRALEKRASAVAKDCDHRVSRVDLALYARSGFTPELRDDAARRGILLFEVEDLV